MFDVLIIGGGPAGVSAALYAARGGASVAIVKKDGGSLAKAERIENFYGQSLEGGAPSGAELAERGIAQARALGVTVLDEEVLNLNFETNFTVNSHEAKTVVLATGASHAAPNIPGLMAMEGHGVSYCAVCDGFFYRKKNVAVLGGGAYALHEAETLLPLAASVTILTNGKPLTVEVPDNIKVVAEPITEICGGGLLENVVFESGEALNISGLFIAVGVAGGTDLAKKIGAVTKDHYVTADQYMRTSVPGLWAAGDCTGGMKQIAKAAYDGAVAGTDVIRYLREKK